MLDGLVVLLDEFGRQSPYHLPYYGCYFLFWVLQLLSLHANGPWQRFISEMSSMNRTSLSSSSFFWTHLVAMTTAVFLGALACGDDMGPDTNIDTTDAGYDSDIGGGLGLEPEPWPEPRDGCNGHPDLCDRHFHEIVFPATHNAMSNAEDGWGVPNQNLPLRTQLIDGIRVFLLDTYEENDEILLCHAACQIGSRPLIDAMEEFRSFLEENPDEVITIIFEDHISGEKTVEVLQDSGIDDFVYTHDADEGWPTLAEMIDADTRLVITNESAGPPPDWMHHVWDLGWDTPFSFSSIDEFNCSPNRGTLSGDLFLINHWVLDPVANPDNAPEVNSYEVLMERVDECQEQWERLPTFIAVDFYDVGDIFEVVGVLNGLTGPR